MTLGSFHTATYPVAVESTLRHSFSLPEKRIGEVRTYRADLTAFLTSAARTIGSVAALADASLTSGALTHDATSITFALGAGTADVVAPTVQLDVALVPDGRLIWTLIQPIDVTVSAIPNDAVTIGGQVITAEFQPVEITLLAAFPGGALGSDRLLAMRDGVLGTVPPSAGGGAAAEYVHQQAMPSATWIITHNLGRRPMPRVVTTAGDLVEGDVHFTSADSLTLTFAAPFAGTAYL